MDVSSLSSEEAYNFLKQHQAQELLTLVPHNQIGLLVQKANEYKKDPLPTNIAISKSSISSITISKQQKTIPLRQQVKNFKNEMGEWAKDGYKLVPPQIFQARIDVCRQCEFWEQLGGTVIGKCNKCGCTSAKHKIATSRCPLPNPKWTNWKPPF